MEKKSFLYGLINKRKAVLIMVLILFIIGGVCYYSIPKQQFPVIQLPVVIITTVYPGAAPSDIEELVTDKIEDVCMEAEGFNDVKSSSYNGVSVVQMMFVRELTDEELRDDIDSLRTKIEELRENELPEGVTSLTFNDDAFRTCGLILTFTGDNRTNEELVQRAEALKDKIQGTKGVIKTEVEGELNQQVKITVDSSKLSHTQISLAELADVIAYQNSIIPVGTMKFDDNEIYINSSGKFKDIEEIRDIIISGDPSIGAVVRLRDVADVELAPDEKSKAYKYNGKDSVILSVFFDESVNVLDVSETVKGIIEDYRETIPSDIDMDIIVDLSEEVGTSINDFIVNLIESVIIVLVIVMIGMSIRNGSIVAFVIPFTIFLTFIAMAAFDIDVQFVSLASLIIALGMLVDNAIVVSDAIQTRIDSGEEKIDACVNGTKEVALPVLSSMLTTVFIFCVFYSLPGTMQRFVFSLPTIVIAALVFSYIVSMTVTPIL
ncbi:MAG: efflux RND transporter permease subunit [Firmicutes bacterium]|nr:efflux RND transporter permease subunit [Bacillota bacterium]